jgi:hypothetical protein
MPVYCQIQAKETQRGKPNPVLVGAAEAVDVGGEVREVEEGEEGEEVL